MRLNSVIIGVIVALFGAYLVNQTSQAESFCLSGIGRAVLTAMDFGLDSHALMIVLTSD